METKPEVKSNKSKIVVSTTPIRVKRETRKRIAAELARMNKKDFGRKIRPDDLINLALALVTQAHRDQLQSSSLSNADRLEQKYREYVKANPGTTKEQFLGALLDGTVSTSSAPTPSKAPV